MDMITDAAQVARHEANRAIQAAGSRSGGWHPALFSSAEGAGGSSSRSHRQNPPRCSRPALKPPHWLSSGSLRFRTSRLKANQ